MPGRREFGREYQATSNMLHKKGSEVVECRILLTSKPISPIKKCINYTCFGSRLDKWFLLGRNLALNFLRPGDVLKSQGGASIQTYARYVLHVIMSNNGPNSNEAINKIGSSRHIWVFPKIGVPQNGWFTMEIPIKMDDLRVLLFSETSIYLVSSMLNDCSMYEEVAVSEP